mgnify:CR=1 FL=1
MGRNYRKEYDNYQGKPEQIKQRALRNAAHRKVEEKLGHKTSQDVDHSPELNKGGTNALTNLNLQKASKNRSFPRNSRAGRK